MLVVRLLTKCLHKSCCGKRICLGCHYSILTVHGIRRCPFCRNQYGYDVYDAIARQEGRILRRAKEKKDPHSLLLRECLARPNALV